MKLRFKILVMCLTCTLTALLLQTFLFQETSSKMIYNWAKEENENTLQNMQNEIFAYLKNMESNLIEIYDQKDLISAMKAGESVEALKAQFYRKAYEVGTTDFETSDSVVALYLYSPEHKIISTYRRAMTPKHNYPTDLFQDSEYTNTEIIREFVDSERTGMLISSYYNEYRETDILHFVLKLYDNQNYKQVIGYVVCDVDSKAVRTIMKKYSTDKSVYTWLQPENDRSAAAIGTLSEEEQEMQQRISAQIQMGTSGGTMDSSEQVLFRVEQNKYNLAAYSLMPQELLKENQSALTANLILIGFSMVLAAAVLTLILSRSLTKPLEKLMVTMQEIKEGNTSLRADIQNEDEIGMLGRNFNEMLDNMEELTEKKEKATELLSKAEYNALQAQINPHFLYNTLDTMSSIAQIQDCPEVSRLSQSLANIFRYSLNMKDSFSTISKEIVHLKNYSYVMSVRMQDHVQYIYDIDKEALGEKIPRLSLQPLVENALNHGLRNKRGEKCVKIKAKISGDDLIICIEDNGVGMQAEEFNKKLWENNVQYIEKGNSIGIYNINARFKMLYGEEYGLWIESEPGKGTKVFARMPRGKE